MMEDLAGLLFSFRGRINRTMWWIGSIITIAASLAATYFLAPGYFGFASETPSPSIAESLTQLALLWPMAALSVKRFADCGWPRWQTVVWPAVVLVLASSILDIGPHFGFMVDYDHFTLGEQAALMALAISGVTLVLHNGCVPGTPGPNRYGPDPSRNQAQTA